MWQATLKVDKKLHLWMLHRGCILCRSRSVRQQVVFYGEAKEAGVSFLTRLHNQPICVALA